MQKRSITTANESSTRYSLPLIPAPVQSPSLLMNKREQRRQSYYISDVKKNSATPVSAVRKMPSFNTNDSSNKELLGHISEEATSNKGEAAGKRKSNSNKRSSRLLRLISSQQQQYEFTMQIAALSDEINFLKDKLIYTEERVCKWKKEFKDLQCKFIQVVTEHTKTREELEDTRRMLEESEHIRSRWFVKKPPQEEEAIVAAAGHHHHNTVPKKSTSSYQHHSHSLPNNLLRFLKFNPRKSSSTSTCKTPAV